VTGLPEQLFNKEFPFELKTGFSSETTLLTPQVKDPGKEYIETISFNYVWLGLPVIRKAIQQMPYNTLPTSKRNLLI